MHAFLGEEVFAGFALSYLREFPSQSYTLGRLADRFVEFLDRTRKERFSTAPTQAKPDWATFLVELARLEHTIDQVFDGPGHEQQPPDLRAALDLLPPQAWSDLRFIPAVCLRLLAFEFPVNDFYSSFRAGHSLSLPPTQRTYLALTRQNYVVRRYPLTLTEFHLLANLVEGQTLQSALSTLHKHLPNHKFTEEQFFTWFSNWTRANFFSQVQVTTR